MKYNLSQQDSKYNLVVPNNYCGGYALAAVINSIKNKEENVPPGIDVYNEIQTCQVDVKGVESNAFIGRSKVSGTAMSLPSSIAFCAKKYNLMPTVYLTPEAKTLFEEAFIDEEKKRLTDDKITIVENHDASAEGSAAKLKAIFSSSGCAHFLVLVNDGSHWVAVKQLPSSSSLPFHYYDPADGPPVEIGSPCLPYAGIVIAFK